jgi:hypothetical protein
MDCDVSTDLTIEVCPAVVMYFPFQVGIFPDTLVQGVESPMYGGTEPREATQGALEGHQECHRG